MVSHGFFKKGEIADICLRHLARSAKGCATRQPATPLRYASLPLAGPRPADRSGERIKNQPVGQRTIAPPAVVLEPSGMSGIGAEIFAAHRVMLAADRAAQTGEIAFGEIGVDAILAIGLGMIDPLELKAACQQIPMGHFVRRQDRTWFHPRIRKINALSLAQEAPRQGTEFLNKSIGSGTYLRLRPISRL
jgi:hypothetical protein